MTGFIWDMLSQPIRKKHNPPASFAEALTDGLGPTICKEFYFPYARKLWGKEPEDVSVIQAQKRVSADSFGKLIMKVLSLMPGFKKEGAGIFYYPTKGYGQISQVMADEVERLGGEILLSQRIEEIHLENGSPTRLAVKPTEQNGTPTAGESLNADFVFSTIPVTILASLLRPGIPQAMRDPVNGLEYRSMVLHYLILDADQFTEYDAHYFPGENVRFSRLSEPKNYSALTEPAGRTGLCFEIPCAMGDELWNASDDELTEIVRDGMAKAGLPVEAPIQEAFSRRVPQVYPIYSQSFDKSFEQIDQYLTDLPNLVPLGRQALFAHDNTHHTMEMAYRASDCLGADLSWDAAAWQTHRDAFEKHVVVD